MNAATVAAEIVELQASAALNKRLALHHRRQAKKDLEKLHNLVRLCAAAGITIVSGIDQGVIADAIQDTASDPRGRN